ncbi:unnamed protein product [Linum trigynum]|uniref:Ty3 transposon capsid-like protein domain-containing protein n=1 Tax=Linum trigynum TaxID=586398 RepID=A0AAV2DE94_9ROSI
MAPEQTHNTRLSMLEEQMTSVDEQMSSVVASIAALQDTQLRHSQSFDKIEASLQMLLNRSSSPHSTAEPSDRSFGRHQHRRTSMADHYPRLDLPFFNGTDPHAWLRKCAKYFQIHSILDAEKVELASLYLEGRANIWYEGWSSNRQFFQWDIFVADLLYRFGDKDQLNIVGAFNKLRQDGSVSNYQEEFEELRARMLRLNPNLTESYFIMSFLSGLDEEIQPRVQMLMPQTLPLAFHQARLEEMSIAARKKKTRPPLKWLPPSPAPPPKKFPSETSSMPSVVSDHLSNSRNQGLCFKCGDKYFYGHVCAKKKQIQVLQADESMDASDDEIVDLV